METRSAATPEDQPSPAPAVGLPVSRRLPPGVDYAQIKMIIMALPSSLTTIVWRGDPTADPIWAAFKGKTLRAIDRQLRRREEILAARGQCAPENERILVRGLRHQWLQLCMHEMNEQPPRKRKKWIIVALVNPARLRPKFRLPGPFQPRTVVEVWRTSRHGPVLIDARALVSTVPPWGEPEITWLDPDGYHNVCAAPQCFWPC
jgi:hypothetical protein